jgi:hypothetical protein
VVCSCECGSKPSVSIKGRRTALLSDSQEGLCSIELFVSSRASFPFVTAFTKYRHLNVRKYRKIVKGSNKEKWNRKRKNEGRKNFIFFSVI